MFYCKTCAEKNGWPYEPFMPMSRGKCEMCAEVGLCADRPSSRLPGRGQTEEACDNCDGRGFFFPWRDDTGLACVEKCDQCGKFKYDDEAAGALGALVLPKDYAVANICLPGMRWEDAGAGAFVVMKHFTQGGGTNYYCPLTFEEGIKLARELGFEKVPERVCCPKCGGTNLSVQLPAVFRWDGAAYALGPEDLTSDEFPIERDAIVVCNGQGDVPCAHTCKIAELVPGKEA
jgi:hypothetical protein